MKKKRNKVIGVIVILLLMIVGLLLIIDPFNLIKNESKKVKTNNTTKTEETTKKTETKKTEEKKTEEKKEEKKSTEETKKTEDNSKNNTSDNSSNNAAQTKINDSEIVGKWNTVKAIHSEDGTEITNLRDLFGSSYSQFGSYLELKDDGTFEDAIEPVSRSDRSTQGTYTIERNYNKVGDCYIFLNYSDGTIDTLKRIYLDEDETPYLVLDGLIHDYKVYLKK